MIAEVFGLHGASVKRYHTEMSKSEGRKNTSTEQKDTVDLKKLETILVKLGHPEHFAIVRDQLDPNGVIAGKGDKKCWFLIDFR